MASISDGVRRRRRAPPRWTACSGTESMISHCGPGRIGAPVGGRDRARLRDSPPPIRGATRDRRAARPPGAASAPSRARARPAAPPSPRAPPPRSRPAAPRPRRTAADRAPARDAGVLDVHGRGGDERRPAVAARSSRRRRSERLDARDAPGRHTTAERVAHDRDVLETVQERQHHPIAQRPPGATRPSPSSSPVALTATSSRSTGSSSRWTTSGRAWSSSPADSSADPLTLDRGRRLRRRDADHAMAREREPDGERPADPPGPSTATVALTPWPGRPRCSRSGRRE